MVLTTQKHFSIFVANECRALHTLFHAVNMYYSETIDQIDKVLLVQEVAFMTLVMNLSVTLVSILVSLVPI